MANAPVSAAIVLAGLRPAAPRDKDSFAISIVSIIPGAEFARSVLVRAFPIRNASSALASKYPALAPANAAVAGPFPRRRPHRRREQPSGYKINLRARGYGCQRPRTLNFRHLIANLPRQRKPFDHGTGSALRRLISVIRLPAEACGRFHGDGSDTLRGRPLARALLIATGLATGF